MPAVVKPRPHPETGGIRMQAVRRTSDPEFHPAAGHSNCFSSPLGAPDESEAARSRDCRHMKRQEARAKPEKLERAVKRTVHPVRQRWWYWATPSDRSLSEAGA